MPIITLTSDMGLRDHYVAAVKAAILSRLPGVNIVDVSHAVPAFDNAQAAFVLGNCYNEFPEGTVHILGVNPDADELTRHLVVRQRGHWFVGADNGIFGLLFPNAPEQVYALRGRTKSSSSTFTIKTIFAPAACHLAGGGAVQDIADPVASVRQQMTVLPATDHNHIRGTVVYVDGYGNAVCNITRDLFDRIGQGREFVLRVGRSGDHFNTLHSTYGDVPEGERVAFFAHNGQLEIAINKGAEGHGGGFNRLFGARVQDPVLIEFAPPGARAEGLQEALRPRRTTVG
jgi:S-adenosyl-L-methionine hydrolase (adenosine-forming)